MFCGQSTVSGPQSIYCFPRSQSISVKYFHQVLKGNNAKQKSYAKSFKIVLSLAYDRMPTKPQLMNLGKIAYLINDLNSVNQCFILVIKTVTEWSSVQNSYSDQYPGCCCLDERKIRNSLPCSQQIFH